MGKIAVLGTQSIQTDRETSARMRRIPKTRTGPEQVVARYLRGKGVRYTRRNKDLPGNPDFANRRRRWVIFVNGCFWHHHTGCRHATTPKRNTVFWDDKFRANRDRDARAVRGLRAQGFRVHILWECGLCELSNRLAGLHQGLVLRG